MIDVRCKQIASIDVKLTVAEVKNVSHLMWSGVSVNQSFRLHVTALNSSCNWTGAVKSRIIGTIEYRKDGSIK